MLIMFIKTLILNVKDLYTKIKTTLFKHCKFNNEQKPAVIKEAQGRA